MYALLQHPVPGIRLSILQSSILINSPFFKESYGAILVLKISRKGLLEATAEDGACARVLLAPTIEVAIAVLPRAAQVLANLCVAIDHLKLPSRHPKQPSGRGWRWLATLRRTQSYRGSEKGDGHRSCGRSGLRPGARAKTFRRFPRGRANR